MTAQTHKFKSKGKNQTQIQSNCKLSEKFSAQLYLNNLKYHWKYTK